MGLKRLIQFASMRLMQIGRAEDARRVDALARDRAKVGSHTTIDFTEVFWKEGAQLEVGENSTVVGTIQMEREGAQVSLGARTYCASLISCASKIEIGSDVLISNGGFITDHQSHAVDFNHRKHDVLRWQEGRKDWEHIPIVPVRIADKSWLGFGVIVLPGVTIGEGAVVGAGSVVTRDIPPYSIAARNPVRIIRDLPKTDQDT